jgi:hypothetical protein
MHIVWTDGRMLYCAAMVDKRNAGEMHISVRLKPAGISRG